MKKYFAAIGLMLAALTLTNCQKDLSGNSTPTVEPNFEIFAVTADTKTVNDGLDTKWAENDAINVFHAQAGTTTYISDGKFSVTDTGTGRFSGTVSETLEGSYDWYALYPYSEYVTTPASTSAGYMTVGGTSQTQSGNDSRAHLSGAACPLYGIAQGIGADETPSMTMNHLSSVVKVKVTNKSGEALTVSRVAFTGAEDIAGTYYIDFTASPVAYKSSGNNYVSKTVNLKVSGGEAIADGASAAFYIAVKPFTATAGTMLTLSVNGYEKNVTLTEACTFTAGHIKELSFTYDKPTVDYSGTYLIVDKDETKVCPAFTSGNNNIPAVDYSVAGTQASWAMTVQKASGSSLYTIQDANSLYLSTGAASSKNHLMGLETIDNNRSLWAISENTDGTFSIVATNSAYSNILSYNSSSKLFSCYGNTGQTAVKLIKYVELPNLDTPDMEAEVQNLNSIYVLWSPVTGAKSYTVQCGTERVVVDENGSDSYEHTFTGLSYSTDYSVSVVAAPSDETAYRNSLPATKTLTTGENPGGNKITYQHIFNTKPSIGTTTLSNVSWTVAATNLGNYNSGNYAGVQFGTSDTSGSITLTSASAWSYSNATKITEVRIWLNAGTGTPTATVTIGGKSAISDGTTVKKNSSAKSYEDATKVTFTPATDGNTGVVVINAATTSKAAYICAMEIDCE